MSTLNPVRGVIDAASKGAERVAGIFTDNKENSAQRDSDEQMALMQAYQAEFHARQQRTWIDAVADGFNRLVRPFIVILVVSIFVVAYVSPPQLTQISAALANVPQGYWALLSVIIAFYFGGRMQLKAQQFRFDEHQARAVKALMESKKAFRRLEIDRDEPDTLIGDDRAHCADVHSARQQQRNAVLELAEANSDHTQALQAQIRQMHDESATSVLRRRRFGPPGHRWRR